MAGELHVVCGCMFAGKSTKAIQTIRQWQSINKHVIAINHSIDNRYGQGGIRTHDLDSIESLATAKLMGLVESPAMRDADIVVIEEAQFFPDLVEFCRLLVSAEWGKCVYVFGLDGNSRREKFGQVVDLCPHADTFVKVQALCKYCANGTPGIFSLCIREVPESGILVGAHDVYAAVCRDHHPVKD